jgi:hypothetical protein
LEKTLEGKGSVSIVRTPVRGSPQKLKQTGFLEDQSGSQKNRDSVIFSEKVIDGGSTVCPLGPLSPRERLFEIYSVRLIGTPNQKT